MPTWARITASFALLFTIAIGLCGFQRATFHAQNVTASGFPATVLDASCQNHGTSSPVSCSAAMTVTVGDTIACNADQFSFGTVGGYVSDATNGDYNAVYQGFFDSSTGHWQTGYIFFGSAGGSITPKITTQGSTSGLVLTCVALKGPPTTNALDGGAVTQFNPPSSAGGVGVTSTNPNSGTAHTPTNAGETIYCGMANIGPTTPTAGTNYALLTSALQSIELWPAYWIQTTATSTNCPYTAASDTWIDASMAIMNAGAATGGVTPFTGFYADLHGNTNGTAVSAANLFSGSNSSVFDAVTCANLSTAAYTNTSNITNRLSPIWVNGVSYAGSTGLAFTHNGSLTTENCKVQLWVNQTGFAELGFTISQTGYTNNINGDLCDVASIAGSAAGDDVTPQYIYNSTTGTMWVRMELTNGATTLTSTGIDTGSKTAPVVVRVLLNMTNSGNQVMKVYNATTGALIGTDTIAVTGIAGGGSSTIVANFMGQGSCGMNSGTIFSYGNLEVNPLGTGFPESL